MRITIETGTPEQPVSVSTTDETTQSAVPAVDAGPAPVGLTASGGLVQEPPAFTELPRQTDAGGALSAGAAPAEEEVGP
ncbi:hypothetical protein ACFY1L_04090 [Streptomyces sp. NPDC001663]|uniref:hypothetical protein n=1 Tax=Streptomyces sp. NPDC001663 TaxID=3364597 RepID=UPI0036B03689